MTDKKKKKDKKEKATKPARPKQERLPGTEDAEISELQETALDYADKRDQRIAILKEETELKSRLLAIMHKHGKTTYDYKGVHVEIVSEEETVKVKITEQE